MSHVVTIEAQVRDPEALRSSCRRLGLEAPVHQTIKLFSAEATGHCVQLPRWRYPVVCDTDTGIVHYDNYEGHWGEQTELDKLVQRYAVEKTVIESRKQGYTVTEQTLADGSIKLSVQVGGAS
ncbi:DUF1257 domain-containing protein [Rosistilla oblonga]|uniref:DUF1257 domain-containing protein n=1 Tax=Rosistilla oblonga TaxID=2527990 RepID=UPI003A974AF4